MDIYNVNNTILNKNSLSKSSVSKNNNLNLVEEVLILKEQEKKDILNSKNKNKNNNNNINTTNIKSINVLNKNNQNLTKNTNKTENIYAETHFKSMVRTRSGRTAIVGNKPLKNDLCNICGEEVKNENDLNCDVCLSKCHLACSKIKKDRKKKIWICDDCKDK